MAKNTAKKPPPQAKPHAQGGKPVVKGNVPPVVTPKAPHKPPPKVMPRDTQKIWADDDDIDLEDVTFVVPIVISAILLFIFFLRQYLRWTVQCPSPNRLEGKTVVITGANTGIGKATATELAKRGARVILGCRDHHKGEAVARMIRTKSKNQDVFSYQLDLASLSSIKGFVEDFSNKESSLHVLINNAAYMGPRATTDDHYERCFAVNYLGHFMLTNLLMDRLKRGAPSRIINVVSDAYKLVKLDLDDLALAKYDVYKAYARSKLAMVIFNAECHRRFFPDVVFTFGVHPGMVCTDLMRNWPGFKGNLLRTIARIFFKSPDDGCQTVVFCAVADKLREQSGKVFENCQLYKIKDYAKDKELGSKLWETSLHLCGLDEEAKYEKDTRESDKATKSTPPEVGASEAKKEK